LYLLGFSSYFCNTRVSTSLFSVIESKIALISEGSIAFSSLFGLFSSSCLPKIISRKLFKLFFFSLPSTLASSLVSVLVSRLLSSLLLSITKDTDSALRTSLSLIIFIFFKI